MSNRAIAFSTLLKLLELDEKKKRTMLKGFLRGGGFNYWRPLQALAQKVVSKEIELAELSDSVARMATSHRFKYNKAALGKLLEWSVLRNVSDRKKSDSIAKPLGSTGFDVRYNPEAVFEMGGHIYFMHIWATNTPSLSDHTLSMGLHLFRKHFKSPHYENAQYLIYDTVKDRIFSEISILSSAPTFLKEQELIIQDLWRDVRTPEGNPSNRTPKYEEEETGISPSF